MPQSLQILIAEDNPADAALLLRALRRAGFEFAHQIVDNEADYLAHLQPRPDIILSDYEMPQFGGLRALELLQERGLEIPFIIVSGTIGEDLAVAAMKLGAADYLLKDRLARLGPAVNQAIEQGQLRRERRRTEEALRESEERFRQVVQNIEEVFWMTNLEKTEMLFVSVAYEKVWGRTCESLYAAPRSWLEAIHPEDRERVLRAAHTQQAAGSFNEEYRIIRPDGSVRWISDCAFPVYDEKGRVYRVAGVAEDITERRRAREELKLFRNLVDQSTDTFEVIDPESGRFLDVNAKGPAELGYSRSEYLALRVFDIDPSISADAWLGIVQEMRTSGFVRGEASHRRKDGASFPIEFNAKLVRLDRDYVVASIRDITERQRAEQRVREQAAMLDLARDAIIVRRFSDYLITFWNKGAERLYGWTPEEAVGRSVLDLIFSDPAQLEPVTAALLERDEWRGELHHRAQDGEKIIVSTRATLVRDACGEPQSVLVINTDITEQKELESRFLRAQRMESIGTLASGVAHDLNNILAPIMMSVPLLRRDLSPEARAGIALTIEMSAKRGAEIVKQVLTFGRGLEGEKRPLRVGAVIEELVAMMRETIPRDIIIENAVAPDLWPVVADSTQMHQVLLNLCVNARDAMPDGGSMQIRAANLDVDASYASMLPEANPGPHVLLEVRDSGSGIPPEIVERIFDPFFTTKGVGQGTGLGLSTVHGIVRDHGGFIKVTTQPGQGTTFHVYLPAAPQHGGALDSTAEQAEIPEGHGEVILFVDDEAPVRNSAQTALEAFGYEVLLAADGTEALAVFAKNSARVAAVLTDLMMPFMDGVSLIHALRSMAPDLPIVASTGLAEKIRLAELRTMQVETILRKPYGAETLLRTVHEVLHSPANPSGSSDSSTV